MCKAVTGFVDGQRCFSCCLLNKHLMAVWHAAGSSSVKDFLRLTYTHKHTFKRFKADAISQYNGGDWLFIERKTIPRGKQQLFLSPCSCLSRLLHFLVQVCTDFLCRSVWQSHRLPSIGCFSADTRRLMLGGGGRPGGGAVYLTTQVVV